jgi:hypothetical protein
MGVALYFSVLGRQNALFFYLPSVKIPADYIFCPLHLVRLANWLGE